LLLLLQLLQVMLCKFHESSGSEAQFSSLRPLHHSAFDHYWTYTEIFNFLQGLNTNYPQFVEIVVLGTTYEGRRIRALRITNEATLTDERPVIFITAGTVARDWIGVMASLKIIFELVEHNSEFADLLNEIEFQIVPLINPDGFIFSQTEGVSDGVDE